VTVPMHDSVSDGAYAFTSVTGQPSVMVPRPAVGRGNFEAAVNAVYTILTKKYEGVTISIDRDSLREDATKIEKALKEKLGIAGAKICPLRQPKDKSNLDILIFDHGTEGCAVVWHPSEDRWEDPLNLYIGIPVKRNTEFSRFVKEIEHCNKGIFLGPGSYENAAILAAQILTLSLPKAEREALEGRIIKYINTKTANSIFGFER